MGKRDAIEKLEETAKLVNMPSRAHKEADEILLEFLRGSGNEEVAAAFVKASDAVGFWYA